MKKRENTESENEQLEIALNTKANDSPDETTISKSAQERDCDVPTLSQWKELYEVARTIRAIEPWNYMHDTDLITIMLPDREEPVYCSIMGLAGECYGIGVYPGLSALASLQRMVESSEFEPNFLLAFEQNCLMCYFGNREELSAKERNILKSLNIKFRGRNEWIYFRSMLPGYYPWYLNSEQVELMTAALQNLVMALKHYLGSELEVDFDEGETLLRFYSPEHELWLNTVSKLPVVKAEMKKTVVTDEILMAKIKKKKKTAMRIEFEATYLPAPVQENKKDRPYLPRIILLADKITGLPLDQRLPNNDEVFEEAIISVLAQYIMNCGRPASICVRDSHTGRYIEDFCTKAEVELIDNCGVPAIDSIFEGLLSFI